MRRLLLLSLFAAIAACSSAGGGSGYGDDDDDDDVVSDDDDDDDAATEPPGLEGTVQAHNDVRSAHGVGPMTWSTALAATAQAWAEQCVDDEVPTGLIDHNPDRSVGHPYYVGENIYGSGGPASGVDAVALWAAEEADYDYDTNTCAMGAVCGHYTQVVWAASTEVGCGIHSCAGLSFGNTVVCNYGPGGNTGGQPY